MIDLILTLHAHKNCLTPGLKTIISIDNCFCRLAVNTSIGGGDTRSPRLARSRRNEDDMEKVGAATPILEIAFPNSVMSLYTVILILYNGSSSKS